MQKWILNCVRVVSPFPSTVLSATVLVYGYHPICVLQFIQEVMVRELSMLWYRISWNAWKLNHIMVSLALVNTLSFPCKVQLTLKIVSTNTIVILPFDTCQSFFSTRSQDCVHTYVCSRHGTQESTVKSILLFHWSQFKVCMPCTSKLYMPCNIY